MRRFGCVAYLLDKEERRQKFDSKTIKGIFVGYATNSTYRVYIPETGRIKTDCDIKFDESRNGCELLSNKENMDQVIENKSLIVELGPGDTNDRIEQEEIEEYDESRNETESSEYEDANVEEFFERNEPEERMLNENEDGEKRNEDGDEIQEQPIKLRNIGRPRGTTKTVMEERRNLRRGRKKLETRSC